MRKEFLVPGRLCLFGEHSDWTGGYRTIDLSIAVGHCLAAGTNQGIRASVRLHPDRLIITSTLPNGEVFGPINLLMDERQLLAVTKEGGFFSYCAGVAYHIQQKFGVGGLVIDNRMDLPLKKGLSSSAAICVLIARAFNQIYELGLTIADEMEFAYQGEILTGSECGRMDQVCACGEVPVFLTFDGNDMQVEQLFPQSPLYLVVVDLKAGKDTKRILADLNHCFMNGHRALRDGLRYALGAGNAQILSQARRAITKGDAKTVGALMNEAQTMFDRLVAPACPAELNAPKLHQILEYPPIQELIWGGKGVGSQGDGSAQFVAKGPEEQDEICRRLEEALDVTCFKFMIQPATNYGVH
jgi:galactokinase